MPFMSQLRRLPTRAHKRAHSEAYLLASFHTYKRDCHLAGYEFSNRVMDESCFILLKLLMFIWCGWKTRGVERARRTQEAEEGGGGK